MKISFIIYADMESILDKIDTRHSKTESSSAAKINRHAVSRYLLLANCSFDVTKIKHDYERGKNFMKNFCKDLKEHAAKIINYEKKEMIP